MKSTGTNGKSRGPDHSEITVSALPLTIGYADDRRPNLTIRLSSTRHALGLAIGSLLLAGCFSLLLIIGRLPLFAGWVGDPLFFKRCLVLHVDLALLIWFFSFAAGLYALMPGDRATHRHFKLGLALAVVGVLTMVAGTLVSGTVPVLSNYVPVIDNRVYVSGLGLFFGGLLLCFVNERLFLRLVDVTTQAPASVWEPFAVTQESAIALKTAALAYLVAMTTILVSWAATSPDLPAPIYYEVVFWGGGHVLQVANVAAMLAVWFLLLSSLLKRPVLSGRVARSLFAVLLAPHLLAPLLTARGTAGSFYRLGFTRLMQFGIAPVVLVLLCICLWRVWLAWRCGGLGCADLRNPRLLGFAISAALTVAGFGIGASIRGVNTVIPAHYHASIGAVTAAFMAVTYVLLEPLGWGLRPHQRRLIPWQLSMFGVGQLIFTLGFGLGGMHGLSRKAYGAEQYVRSTGEWIGLGLMGAGGLVAVAGGLLFLWLILCAIRPAFAAIRLRLSANIFWKSIVNPKSFAKTL